VKGELEVALDLPPARAFERLAAPESLLGAVSEVTRLRRTAGRGGEGTRYEATLEVAGRSEVVTAEVVAFDRPRHIAYTLDGRPGAATLDLDVGPKGRGSRLRCVYSIEFRGLTRLVLGPLAKAWLRKNEDQLKDRIAEALDSAPAARGRRRRA
jgi:hypothetical protein